MVLCILVPVLSIELLISALVAVAAILREQQEWTFKAQSVLPFRLHRADKAHSSASCAGGGAAVAPPATLKKSVCIQDKWQGFTHSWAITVYPAYLACIFECRIFTGKQWITGFLKPSCLILETPGDTAAVLGTYRCLNATVVRKWPFPYVKLHLLSHLDCDPSWVARQIICLLPHTPFQCLNM